MTAVPVSIVYRGTRRVRAIFSGALGSGAFTSTSYYAIAAAEEGASPITVNAVFAIASSPETLEIAVDSDLTSGALYTVTFTALPLSVGTYTGSVQARVGLALNDLTNVEPTTQDLDLLLYERDLVYDGNDIAEDATGDLLTITGRANWIGALWRRFGSDGLPWDPSYGPEASQYVDAPKPYQVGLAGQLVAQARLDDRTKQATVVVTDVPGTVDTVQFTVSVSGQDGLDPQTFTLPSPS